MSSSKKEIEKLLWPGIVSGALGTAVILLMLLLYAALIRNDVLCEDHCGAAIALISFLSGFLSKMITRDSSREGALTKAIIASGMAALLLLLFSAGLRDAHMNPDRIAQYLLLFGVGNALGGVARIDKRIRQNRGA